MAPVRMQHAERPGQAHPASLSHRELNYRTEIEFGEDETDCDDK